MPDRSTAALTAAAATVLLAAAPSPASAGSTLANPASAGDPTGPVVALAALSAWALVGWLGLVATAALGARLPGLSGRLAAAVAVRIAPPAVRRLVEVALGLTVAAGVVSASPASASPALPPVPPAASASLDWPSPPASLDWNPAVAAPVAPVPPAASTAVVVVRPGDSLWSVAAGHLPVSASEAQIAQAWPAWWAANRDAVGADPDLIHPGLQLTPPAQP